MAPRTSLLPASWSCCWGAQRTLCIRYRNLIPAPNWTPSQILENKVLSLKAGSQRSGLPCSPRHCRLQRRACLKQEARGPFLSGGPGALLPASLLPPGCPASPARWPWPLPPRLVLRTSLWRMDEGTKWETQIPTPCLRLYSCFPSPDPSGDKRITNNKTLTGAVGAAGCGGSFVYF